MLIAGVDIGNSTTEVCIGKLDANGSMTFVSDAMTPTTGLKGTPSNVKGVKRALEAAMRKVNASIEALDMIRLNEAAPVIGDTAMETITETIIAESTMLGHNPATPAGEGLAIGNTIHIKDLGKAKSDTNYLIVADEAYDYERISVILNTTSVNVTGIILQKDEAVLVYNRLVKKVPVIDEVTRMSALPLGALAAIEVAGKGRSITQLSNPYGIAKIFNLRADETRQVIPVAKSLIGKKSAVVIHTPKGGVKEKSLAAGTLIFEDIHQNKRDVKVDAGAEAIMAKLAEVKELEDVTADANTGVDAMLKRMKSAMSMVNSQQDGPLHIKDILAIDTFVPVQVKGALAGELAMEKAVAIAAMVKAEKLPMEQLADLLRRQLNIPVIVAGIEAVMASVGALTTKGTCLPIAILDLGGGSTDAAILSAEGEVRSIHLAGAGAFVTMMINEELALENEVMAEWIKKYPLAKVDSLHHMSLENGEVLFFKEPLDPRLYGRVAIIKDEETVPVMTDHSLEKIVNVRRSVKKKVFVMNALRALKQIAPDGDIRKIPNVVLVGGSALDSEIPEMIQEALAEKNIVAGRGDIRGEQGPRNAVATGLCMSFINEVRR